MKKIIFSICIIILYIIFGNITYVEAASSYAATVTNDGMVSYITAGKRIIKTDKNVEEYEKTMDNNYNMGLKKMSFYNTKGLQPTREEPDPSKSKAWELFAPWKGKNTITYPYQLPSFYKKGIWREKIGGSDAFCLNPGLKISTNGYTPEGTTEVKNFLSLGNEEKIYAIIYYADFTGLNVYYADGSGRSSFTIGEEGDYIIKQILFWTYIAHPNFWGFGSRSLH